MMSSVEILARDYRMLSAPELERRFVNAWFHREFYPTGAPNIINIVGSVLHEGGEEDKREIYMKIRRRFFEIKDENPEMAMKMRDMMHYFVSEVLYNNLGL